ncbi:MAG: hypothetical protein ACTSWW_04475 [Promethearchaeota archaeon]
METHSFMLSTWTNYTINLALINLHCVMGLTLLHAQETFYLKRRSHKGFIPITKR